MNRKITATPGETHCRQDDIIKTENNRLLKSGGQNQDLETRGWYTTHATNKSTPSKGNHFGTILHLGASY